MDTVLGSSVLKMKGLRECEPPDTSEVLHALWRVISDKDSADQVDRQLILLDTYLTYTETETGGCVRLSDLLALTRVLGFVVERAETETCYKDPMQKIIRLLNNLPIMKQSSDETVFGDYLVEFFSYLGCILLQSQDKQLKSKVLEILLRNVTASRDATSVPARACVRAVDLSEFIECLADFMSVADEELYLWTVHTACQLCATSYLSCWTLLIKNVIDTLLVRLTTATAEGGQRAKALDYTSQLMWMLFRCTDHQCDWQRVPSPSRLALHSLRYVLREEALVHTYPGRADNSLINLAALTLKMMHLFPEAEYVNSGLLEDIVFYATLTEAVIAIHILPRFKNTSDHLQFKTLMLACLSISPITTITLKLFDQFKVAECLVSLLDGGSRTSEVQTSIENCIELIKCVLPIVCALYEHLWQSFIDKGLIKSLMKILTNYIEPNIFPDNLSLDVIKTVFLICFHKANAKATREALRQEEAVHILLNLCVAILESNKSFTIFTQTLLYHTLGILTALMENEKDIQQCHSKTCCFIVSTLYRRFLEPLSTDSLTDNRLLVIVSNFAWETLIRNASNVTEFYSTENFYIHLDILEKSPFSVQMVYLSVLVDLCEYRQSIPYLISWRGPAGLKLLSLLCRIWREEEKRLGVPRSEKGCITDIERPLMGEDQTEIVKRYDKKTVSVYDVFGSARPKIHAIIQLMHRYDEEKNLCEEHYMLGHDRLPPEDHVTLQIVEAFLPLKLGEIWWEVMNKQVPGQVVPLDRYLAETLAHRYLDWALSVQRAQHCLLEDYNTQLQGLEQQYYTQAHSNQLTAALAALREVVAVARSADRQWLIKEHQRLCDGIAASRARPFTAGGEVKEAYLRPRGLNLILFNSQADLTLDLDHHQSQPSLPSPDQ